MIKTNALLLFLILLTSYIFPQTQKIIESNHEFIKIEFDFTNAYKVKDTLINNTVFQYVYGEGHHLNMPGDPWLPAYSVNIGIPHFSNPKIRLINLNQSSINNVFILPYPTNDLILGEKTELEFNEDIYSSNKFYPDETAYLSESFIMRYSRVIPAIVSPYQFNPVTRELIFNEKIIIQVDFNIDNSGQLQVEPVTDLMSLDFIRDNTINHNQALNWIGKNNYNDQLLMSDSSYWYNPVKDYFKIYTSKRGVYRITYEELLNAGVPIQGAKTDLFELYNYGKLVPIDVMDGGKGILEPGDYFQFVAELPQPSPGSGLNIYNNTNVYWFSYQSDSTGLYYKYKDGNPYNFNLNSHTSSLHTIRYEEDKIYERMGYATPPDIDYWFWGRAIGRNGSSVEKFTANFQSPIRMDFGNIETFKVRINVYGMTGELHNAFIHIRNDSSNNIFNFTGDGARWHGTNFHTFEYDVQVFTVSNNPNHNYLGVEVYANLPGSYNNDQIRINWFEFEYERLHRVRGNNFTFKSPPMAFGPRRFYLWRWTDDNMKIYIPQKNTVLFNPDIRTDEDQSVYFLDTINQRTEYFCVSDSYFYTADSVVRKKPSNIRNTAQGADYIIITHSKFLNPAERLKLFRENNLHGFDNPRVSIIDVNDIYDEFSFGLLDPYSLQEFVKYAFNNWQTPAASYVALLGDMSWDYRKVVQNSRPNFIPAIPHHSYLYGQAASDNLIVAVVGNDVIPDLAIGRISCETVEEANILIDKIIGYPEDTGKEWKSNILLISSGIDDADENKFQFNDQNIFLDNTYISPKGYNAEKIFRYPNKPEYLPFQGERPQIREAFNRGNVLTNFYGHGGGYQWDFVFLSDDIYLLNNGGRLPLILSVTCYTAHFDNQDVFGEQFNKVPGKGSIGFWGHTGVTFWFYGVDMNKRVFNQIFNHSRLVVGDAFLNAKASYPPNHNSLTRDHINLLTLLGDPAIRLALPLLPDFNVRRSDISISPEFPLIGDTVDVSITIRNAGRIFPNDSVTVELFIDVVDTSSLITSKKISSFPYSEQLQFKWVPNVAGLHNLIVELNRVDVIDEEDYTDNSASIQVSIFNISEPNIIKPIYGASTNENKMRFVLADIGNYILKDLVYFIEIDTTTDFNSPIIKSPQIFPNNGIAEWFSPELSEGYYFWRARILDEDQFSNWTSIGTFSVKSDQSPGSTFSGKQLKLFPEYNMVYDDKSKSLILNNDLLPAMVSNSKLIDSVSVILPNDSTGLTAITTDGEFIYFGHRRFLNSTSKIFKVGTGNNNTFGEIYGEIPNLEIPVANTIFYHTDGYLYIATGKSHSLLKVNIQSGDTSSVFIPSGLLEGLSGVEKNGVFYLTSDGEYVYNISHKDSLERYGTRDKYIVRILDPANNWNKVKDDIVLFGTSFIAFSDFYVIGDYLYVNETWDGWIRRYNLNTTIFEDEWVSFTPFQGFYSWTYDWERNEIYGSVFPNFLGPKIHKFIGDYNDFNGEVFTFDVGPASRWINIDYDLETEGSLGSHTVELQGLKKPENEWLTIINNLQPETSIENFEPNEYEKMRMRFTFSDSSTVFSESMKLKSVNFNFESLPEIVLSNSYFSFTPDSLLQGYPLTMYFKVPNYGNSSADSLLLVFYLNEDDSIYTTKTINVPADTFVTVDHIIPTSSLLFENRLEVIATLPEREFYTFNNLAQNKFYVSRDTLSPIFSITFDGKEIINGDIISDEPEIMITLNDNSPLSLDTSYFSLAHNNLPLRFNREDITYSFTEYPNNQAVIMWNPKLKEGRQILEVLAKDASGNFFDSTSYRVVFYVYNTNEITQIFNYPNPFKDDTHFTFELRGTNVPEELKVKIYTIAGRLIREFEIPENELQIGFNKFYWDGRDQDGDEIANGVYFYKVISKNNGEVFTKIEKLAKIK